MSNKIDSKGLLDGAFAPITRQIGFLEIDAEIAAAKFVEWQQSIFEEDGIVIKLNTCEGDLTDAIQSLLPLTNPVRRREVIIPTTTGWCAFLDNGLQGTDAFSAVSYLAKVLSCRGVRAAYEPHIVDEKNRSDKFGITLFELYSSMPTDFLNIERSISSGFDGYNWEFSAAGTVQPYEALENYDKRSKRDRFTYEMLVEYLATIDIDAFNPAFYTPDNSYFHIEQSGPSPAGMKEYQLDQLS